ncbi:hypothetical protein ACHAXT_012825 [Thalassiosira profunda]
MASGIARRAAFGRQLPLPRRPSVVDIGGAAGALASGCGAGGDRRRRMPTTCRFRVHHLLHQRSTYSVAWAERFAEGDAFASPLQVSVGGEWRSRLRDRSTGLALTNCTSCRRNHSEASTDSDASTAEPQPADGDNGKDTLQQQSTDRRPQSDPTARRPTQKCDPYGLQGASLSRAQCLEWMPTLDDGWRLLPPEGDVANPQNGNADSEAIGAQPVYLQRQYHHPTLHDASQFLTRIGLLATNLNHYPFLSVERVLVDDIHNVGGSADESSSNQSNDNGKRRRKVKGWIFRSTVRCATYRPPVAGAPARKADAGGADEAKGLTYHDFHLAMSVDVEVAREEVRRLLCERTT